MFSYAKQDSENFIIASCEADFIPAVDPLVVTCPESCMKPLYVYGGSSEMLRSYTVTNHCYHNTEPRRLLAGSAQIGDGRVIFSFLMLPSEVRDRFGRFDRRLVENITGKPSGESLFLGGPVRANEEQGDGYAKRLYLWNGRLTDSVLEDMLDSSQYQVERMNPTPILTMPGFTEMTHDAGVWSAEGLDLSQDVILYHTVTSPIARKNVGSNLGIPDPAAQTFLDLEGEGDVTLWLNANCAGTLSLQDGAATVSDLELERMFNHVLLKWVPAGPNSTLTMRWRNIARVPERSLTF